MSEIRTRAGYFRMKNAYRKIILHVPGGKAIYRFTHKMKERWKRKIIAPTLFEEMGFEYYGPLDGHDEERLEYMLRIAKSCKKPVVLHVVTKKGKGYAPAEEKPEVFHGIGSFDPVSGKTPEGRGKTFSATFGQTLCGLARENSRVCAISAAMIDGTGLKEFSRQFPDRCFDVGIAEGHAVAMAGGLAKQGMIPVVAIYSTFLQRAYDMILQDVSMQNLHVVFAVDRAGLVGEDGETHHGVFDINFLRSVPHMQVLCPANQAELEQMLRRAVVEMSGPVAVRYPRGCDGVYREIPQSPVLRAGEDITLISYGKLIDQVLQAAELLEAQGIRAEVLKLPSVKPIDMGTIAASVRKTRHLLIAEEVVCIGCAGKEIAAMLRTKGINVPTALVNIGDRYVTHGPVAKLYETLGLDGPSLAHRAKEVLNREA